MAKVTDEAQQEGPLDEPGKPAPRADDARVALPAGEQDGRAWERDVLNRLAFAALVEQRRTRRWGLAFKAAMLIYVVALTLIYIPFELFTDDVAERHTALVRLDGVIADGESASADRVITGLRAAFEDEKTAGVIMRINSPGGSPVQAGYINDEIRRLRELNPDIPLYAVVTDMCASGGYYVAVAADRIYVDKSSLVGSIGVLMNGFGFVDSMQRLGVERRLYTAGEHKGFLDPFSPQDASEVTHIQSVLEELHGQFIDVVRSGRKDRLRGGDELFSGLVWSGERGIELGLVDAYGSSSSVARDVIEAEEIVDFTPRRDYLERFAERMGAAMASVLSGHTGIGAALPRFLLPAGGPG